MVMADAFETTVAVDKYLKEKGIYDKIQAWFLKQTAYPIVVTGVTGSGKSSLVNSLFGEVVNIDRLNRTDSPKEVVGKLEKKLFIKMIDTPGQPEHEARRKQAFKKALKFNSVGIINVVSFGYHE